MYSNGLVKSAFSASAFCAPLLHDHGNCANSSASATKSDRCLFRWQRWRAPPPVLFSRSKPAIASFISERNRCSRPSSSIPGCEAPLRFRETYSRNNPDRPNGFLPTTPHACTRCLYIGRDRHPVVSNDGECEGHHRAPVQSAQNTRRRPPLQCLAGRNARGLF